MRRLEALGIDVIARGSKQPIEGLESRNLPIAERMPIHSKFKSEHHRRFQIVAARFYYSTREQGLTMLSYSAGASCTIGWYANRAVHHWEEDSGT